jgi:aminoglycoside phosphotransferase (APT) family kinase protein
VQFHQPPHLDEAQVARAIDHALGATPTGVTHIQTKDIRSVYAATLADGREVVLKAENDAPPEEQRLGLEAWAIEQVRGLGIPAPAVLGLDLALTTVPFRYLVIEKAAGVPLHEAGLDPDRLHAALEASGRLLARLHSVRVSGYGSLSELEYAAGGAVAGRFARWAVPGPMRAEAALNELYAAGALDVEEASGAMHLVEDEAATDVTDGCLLHGDYSARHTFVDPATAEITAVIDFGDRLAGPPLWDLAGAWLWNGDLDSLPPDATEAVIEGYETESGTSVPRPRLRTYCLMRLLVPARSYYEHGLIAEFQKLRQRLDVLLEEAGRL